MEDAEVFESAGAFNPNQLGISLTYLRILLIIDSISGKLSYYKESKEFIKKLYICDKDVMQPEEIITFGYFF